MSAWIVVRVGGAAIEDGSKELRSFTGPANTAKNARRSATATRTPQHPRHCPFPFSVVMQSMTRARRFACLFLPPFSPSAADALLSAGQPHAADRLLRQGLQQGYDPLGGATYAHACYTQHSNMLRAWGSEVSGVLSLSSASHPAANLGDASL